MLARLVTLQEIPHGLKVFIITFYIIEMGRLDFEAAAHEAVSILTVIFIPIALLMPMIIRRLLYRR